MGLPSKLDKGFRWPDLFIPAGVSVASTLGTFLRSPTTITSPELWAEDGRNWFADAYNQGPLGPLFTPHTGYLQTFPRLVADFGLHVSLISLPLVFALAALVVQILPAVFVVTRRFEDAIPRRFVRVLIAAVYVAVPNSREVNVNLTNAQWHLGLLALMVVVASPANGAWRVFDMLVIVVSGLTGPFCIALLPVVLIGHVKRRDRWSLALLWVAGVCAIVQIGALVTWPRGHFAPLGASWPRFVEIVGGEVVGGTVLGNSTLSNLLTSQYEASACVALLVGGLVIVFVAVTRGPFELQMLNLFSGLVLGASLVTPVGSVSHLQWQALALDGEMRYWWYPTVALLVDMIWILGRAKPRIILPLTALFLIGFAVLGVPQDWHYKRLSPTPWNAEVKAFSKVPPGTSFTFHIDPSHWAMVLIKH